MKLKQIWFQLWYRMSSRFWPHKWVKHVPNGVAVHGSYSLPQKTSYLDENTFRFLNITHHFEHIDWNCTHYGKLWTYHLNYFDFINQKNIASKTCHRLMQDYISQNETLKDGLEPYPTSLRIINWVKFLSCKPTDVQDKAGYQSEKLQFDNAQLHIHLYNDCRRLSQSLEYHILGNHLLENGFGLLFGAYYFNDQDLYAKAKAIIESELSEQILNDGAHYELSPMYHQIILFRVLDSFNLVSSNQWQHQELKPILESTAQKMLSWLKQMTFNNGQQARVNDTAYGGAPEAHQLINYATKLGILPANLELSDSGYRMFRNEKFEMLCDVGQIAPDYQPGHAHADNLNFIVHYAGIPIIVDTGISTYEKNARRQLERGTASHNTLIVNDTNSSDVWHGFRVGKRAKTTILKENKHVVIASHNGYRHWNLEIHRKFETVDAQLVITDNVLGNLSNHKVNGALHFHPDVKIYLDKNYIHVHDKLTINIEGATNIHVASYQYAQGFNDLVDALKVVYTLANDKVIISINSN